MDAEFRKDVSNLIEDIAENPSAYSMFHATYLAETRMKKKYPDLLKDEFELRGIKFQPYPHYTYFPKNIREVKLDNQIVTFIINLFGLYGPDSPMPRCYHEQVSAQHHIFDVGKIPLQNFLDIFNNRFYWLYYQAWKKYRFYLQISDEPENKTLQRVFSFVGLGPKFVQKRESLNVYKLFQLSGILSTRVRNKSGLRILLREFFPSINVKIKEFIPSMVKINNRPKIGHRFGNDGFYLGQNSFIGSSLLDWTSRICIELGPMDFDTYLELLPKAKGSKLLRQLVSLYTNDGLEYDIKCLINGTSIKNIHWQDKRVKLGQSFWLGTPRKEKIAEYFNYEKYTST